MCLEIFQAYPCIIHYTLLYIVIPMTWCSISGMILLYPCIIIGSNPQTERPRPESWSGHKRLGNYWRVGSGI